MMMTNVSLDELGPVDYVVVKFPAAASKFTLRSRFVARAYASISWRHGFPPAVDGETVDHKDAHKDIQEGPDRVVGHPPDGA